MDLARIADIVDRLCTDRGWSDPKYIDKGASAAVYRVTTKDGYAALKVYDPAFFQGANALIEVKRIALQRELIGHGCPQMVEVLDADELAGDGTWFLLMEFCPWRSLEKSLADVPDGQVHSLIKQLVLAVQFLDSRGLVHRDIKPANIVVSPDFQQLKLLDFGVLRRIAYDEGSGTDDHKFIATAQYSPPEFLSRDEQPGKTGFLAINIYQVGAVLHDLITKAPLFAEEKATKNRFKLYKAVTEKRPRVISASVAPRLIALCAAALDKNPQARAASLKLCDFLRDTDDVFALRRRIAQRSSSNTSQPAPVLAAWAGKVRSWASLAAQLEADTLGPVRMKATRTDEGHRWALEFKAAGVTIFVDLIRSADGLSVHVLGSPDGDRGSPVFMITGEGADIPESGIPGVMAALYLYAVDSASVLAGASPEQEDEA